MTKNIYYASNSHSSKFPKNTRSSFRCQIDPNEFGYFDHQNITAAIKSITFQNSYNNYEAKNERPNMILIQNFYSEKPLSQRNRYQKWFRLLYLSEWRENVWRRKKFYI